MGDGQHDDFRRQHNLVVIDGTETG